MSLPLPGRSISRTSPSLLCACGQCPVLSRRMLHRRNDAHAIKTLDNPFDNCSEPFVKDFGRRVACQYGQLHHVEIFEKAAILLLDYERDHNLTPEESKAVRNETSAGFWAQPLPFRTTCFMLFTAAIVQGWTQTSLNGADVCWLDQLLTSTPTVERNSFGCDSNPYNTAKYAAIEAAPFLFAPIGCMVSDPLNELLLGRRQAIMVSASLIFASSLAGAFMQSWWALLVCRAILGIGMGGKAAITPVFLAEIAPLHLRGSLLVNWQIFDALGVLFGFSANLVATITGMNSWRWQVACSAIPAFALIMGCFFVPWDSPRFLMKLEKTNRERYDKKEKLYEAYMSKVFQEKEPEEPEAYSSAPIPPADHARPVEPTPFLRQIVDTIRSQYGPDAAFGYRSRAFDTWEILRGHRLLAAKELIYAHAQLAVQQLLRTEQPRPHEDVDLSIQSPRGWVQRIYDIMAVDYLRREFVAAMTVLIGQNMTGINVLIFYSTRIFAAGTGGPALAAPLFSIDSLWFSWGIGLTNLICGLPAYWWIESRGRRWLVLMTLPFLALTMGGMAASFVAPSDLVRKSLVAVFSVLFIIFYSPGMGPVPFTLTAELFPLEYRMVGMSGAIFLYFLSGGALNLLVLLGSHEYIVLGIFAGLNLVVWLLAWVYLREPERQSRDAMGEYMKPRPVDIEGTVNLFIPRHRQHIKFQWQQTVGAVSKIGRVVRGEGGPAFSEWIHKQYESVDGVQGEPSSMSTTILHSEHHHKE